MKIAAIMMIGLAAGALVSFGLDLLPSIVPPVNGMVWLVLVGVIAIALGAFLLKRKSLGGKEPWEDERSKKIKALAGYYSFMASIYFILGMMFFGALDGNILSRHLVIVIMLAMLGFFIGFWLFLSRQADVELPE